MKKNAIDEKLKSIARKATPIFRRHNILKASVFGSYARNEQTRQSDIDIIVKFGPDKSLIDLVNLENDLRYAFRKNIDVITYRSIHPHIKKQILDEHKVIYEKPDRSH